MAAVRAAAKVEPPTILGQALYAPCAARRGLEIDRRTAGIVICSASLFNGALSAFKRSPSGAPQTA